MYLWRLCFFIATIVLVQDTEQINKKNKSNIFLLLVTIANRRSK